MKNTSLCFFAVIFLFHSPLFSWGADEPLRDSYKLGAGFFGGMDSAGIVIDFSFSRFATFSSHEGKAQTTLHPYIQLADEWYPNIASTGTSTTKTQIWSVGFGVRMQTAAKSSTAILSPYSNFGLDIGFPDRLLTSFRTSFGFRLGLGADILFLRSIDSWLGTCDSTFFVEGNLTFFHKAADNVTGAPRLREGFQPAIGFRSHF